MRAVLLRELLEDASMKGTNVLAGVRGLDLRVSWLVASDDPYELSESDAEDLVMAPWESWADNYRYEGVVRLKDLGVEAALSEAPLKKNRDASRELRFRKLAGACEEFGMPLIELPEGLRYGRVSKTLARIAVSGADEDSSGSPAGVLHRVFEGIHREEGARLAAVCFPDGIREMKDWPDIQAAVECYLRHKGNAVAAGAELGVHRHTVKSRVQRYEALSGLSLDNPEYRLLIELAFLLLAHRFE